MPGSPRERVEREMSWEDEVAMRVGGLCRLDSQGEGDVRNERLEKTGQPAIRKGRVKRGVPRALLRPLATRRWREARQIARLGARTRYRIARWKDRG